MKLRRLPSGAVEFRYRGQRYSAHVDGNRLFIVDADGVSQSFWLDRYPYPRSGRYWMAAGAEKRPLVQAALTAFSKARRNAVAGVAGAVNQKGTPAVDGSAQSESRARGGDSATGEVPGERGGGGASHGVLTPSGQDLSEPGVGAVPGRSLGAHQNGGAVVSSGEGSPAAEPTAEKAENPTAFGEALASLLPGRSSPGGPAAGEGHPHDGVTGTGAACEASPVAPAAGEEATGEDRPASAASAEVNGAAFPEEGKAPIAGGAEEQALEPPQGGNMLRAWKRASPSPASRQAWGGVFGSLADTRSAARRLVDEARRVFARLAGTGEGDPGPRWHTSRVAIKAVTRRMPGMSDRREEHGRPGVLVLPDVSGSMSAYAQQVLLLAKAAGHLGVAGSDVVVVTHSNGYPLELAVNGRILTRDWIDLQEEASIRFYRDIIRRYHIRAVVAAADWDGEWLYKELAKLPNVAAFFWCDVWSSSKLGVTVSSFPPRWHGPVNWAPEAARKVRYAFGCSDAEEFLRALKKLLGKGVIL